MGIDGLDHLSNPDSSPDPDDIAPDADEPGDGAVPELEELLTEPDGIVPDEVDGPNPQREDRKRIDE